MSHTTPGPLKESAEPESSTKLARDKAAKTMAHRTKTKTPQVAGR